MHLLVCYLNNMDIFVLGEALVPAVLVFEGQSRYRSYTRSRCGWQCNVKIQERYRFWGRETDTYILFIFCWLLKDAVSIGDYNRCECQFQRLRGLWRGSEAARLLGLRVRIPPGAWTSVSWKCCVLSGRGLCVGLITRPDESYRLWRVCDREAWIMRKPWHTGGVFGAMKKNEWLTKREGCGRRRSRLNRCSNLTFVGADYGKRGTPSAT